MSLLARFNINIPAFPSPPPPHPIARNTLLLIAAAVGVAVGLHFFLGHIVIAAYGLLIWLIKTVAIANNKTQPQRWLLMLLTIMSFLLVLLFYGGWNGQRAGISFLVLLASLKFLESQSLRDYFLVCLILLFLASASFLFNASGINISAVILFTLFVITLMQRLADPHPSGHAQTFKTASALTLKALPLAVFLFFFFPRIGGDFGFIPSQDEGRDDSHLQDSLVAGELASSAFSNEPAFRVEFEGQIPPNNLLYWRAKVMVDERNFAWQVRQPTEDALRSARTRSPSDAAPQLQYQIVHEASKDKYLPFLDYALNPTTGIQLLDGSVYRFEKQDGPFAYQGQASASWNLPFESQQKRLANRSELLATINPPSPQVRRLLNIWKSEARNEVELVNQVLNYFRANQFEYSLTPPSLGDTPIDNFLFDTQSGYCEHYASAFTTLMRWLDVPARVVVGYQGGTRNLVGNYLQVRYSDAHAWSEVWINQQWQRVDPTTTATLGQQRIDQGMAALVASWQDSSGSALADYLNPSGFDQAWRRLRDGWDNLGYQWNKWVVNYDFDAQRELLKSLGIEHKNSLSTLIAILFAGTLLVLSFYFWQLFPKKSKLGDSQRLYLDFVDRLRRFKLEKQPSETPLEFAYRAGVQLPWHQQEIDLVTQTYLALRYGKEEGSIEKQEQLKTLIKGFKPHKQKS